MQAPLMGQTAKPLRFVTNYGAPHPKRRRIRAACLTCRKRKTACSGERPYCDTCTQNKLECAGYVSEPAPDAVLRRQHTVANTQHRAHDSIDPALQSGHPSGSHPRHPHVSQTPTDLSTSSDPPRVSLFSGPRNRMPYFRWLGPTAIMPGFKQMVVKINRQDTDAATSSADGAPLLSPTLHPKGSNLYGVPGSSSTSLPSEHDARIPLVLPFYDTSPVPPSELITHLTQSFFTHLGCNFPFLQNERFLRDLEQKQVDVILVDAVCALAARFSTHSLLTSQQLHDEQKPIPADFGHAFAQRAKTALLDTFACPTVAAVQAALLLAYNEFGESRDSGLWMYLGIAIRMAQDLGMHKIEGLRYKGTTGPTPRMVKMGSTASLAKPSSHPSISTGESEEEIEEQKAAEQERVDTFWATFFLDRVVSSGTGRRSTLRDKDIELSFPLLSEIDEKSDWPSPFPALIRIIHLYGRVVDLLNSIKEPTDITTDTPKRLAAMESQVTHLYQGLSTKLHFDAVNFQHYVKAGEGTNFVLLHLWFHTLIVLLHQPTLLKTFEGRMLQLFPNSQRLSMSSAKTIADILSYSQLIDAKVCLGNPFTTQPIYIAACAFLRESAEHTATSNAHSRAVSPQRQDVVDAPQPDQDSMEKHTLLATAATQHYQLCYKALQSVETYWSGTKYIITVLEQKFEGVRDPLLYTVEEEESAMEQPKRDLAFKVPGWRRTQSFSREVPSFTGVGFDTRFWEGSGRKGSLPKTIGWTLTGNMDSSSTNLAWHYPSDSTNYTASQINTSTAQTLPQQLATMTQTEQSTTHFPITSSDVKDASLLLGLHTPFEQSPPPSAHLHATFETQHLPLETGDMHDDAANVISNHCPAGGLMIEQQDIDTSMLGLDTMPWFDPTYGINSGDTTGLYNVDHISGQHAPSQHNHNNRFAR